MHGSYTLYNYGLEAQARSGLVAERGRQFDPQVVDAFLASLEESPWQEPA